MERLQKIIAQAGLASRRKAEEMITAGRVKVNGHQVSGLGTKVDLHEDQIEVDGQTIGREPPVYYIFHKPTGVITSVQDPQGRKVVMDFFTRIEQRIFPVGRLDYDTSGLLLLTNDGKLAYALMHPSFHVKKTYIAKVRGIPSSSKLDQLAHGLELRDGKTAPAEVDLVQVNDHEQTALVQLTIHEGRKRQVRRMLSFLHHPVIALHREKYADLTLVGLGVGQYRALTQKEIDMLRQSVNLLN